MTAAWLPPGKQTFVGLNGEPLVGGTIEHFVPGTDDLKDTWQDYDQTAFNDNPLTLDERGQCIIYGVGNYRQVVRDADGTVVWDRDTTVGVQGNIVLAQGAIFGLSTGNTPGNPDTQISVTVGQCRDSTNTVDLALTTPLTKLLNAPWAPGTIAGGRDTGALAAAQSWHVFLIYNPTDDITDVLFSQSAINPSLPNGYTLFRRIASLPRLGATNVPPSGTAIPRYLQFGNQFELYQGNSEWVNQSGDTSALLRAFLVPLGIKVSALFYAQLTIGPPAACLLRISDPDLGVPPAFGGATQYGQLRTDATAGYVTAVFSVPTDTFGQTYIQVSQASGVWAAKSIGWTDTRGV